MRSGRREVDGWGLQSGWLVGGVIYYEYGDGISMVDGTR